MARPVSSDDEYVTIEHAVAQKAQLARIKSFGSAPRKPTPTPTQAAHDARDSVPIEQMMLPHGGSTGPMDESPPRNHMAYLENGPTRPKDEVEEVLGGDKYAGKSFFIAY
jgi:hypothetical protein